ncbi:MAG: hypothetical protein AABY26_03180 [Nanoarchaeota archaeon]
MLIENLSGQALPTTTLPESIQFVQPLVDVIQPLIFKVALLLGGLVGIYLLLLFMRVYYERQVLGVLKDIRYDLDQLNLHYKLNYSKQRQGRLMRIVAKILSYFRSSKKK